MQRSLKRGELSRVSTITRYTTRQKKKSRETVLLSANVTRLCEPRLDAIANEQICYVFVCTARGKYIYERFALTSKKMKFHIIRITDAREWTIRATPADQARHSFSSCGS